MATIRRYGPVLGAGTTITEKLAEKTITPSPLGVVAWAGLMEKGPTDELIEVNGKSDFYRKCGGRIPDSYLPDCAEDFWDASRGAGKMFLARVTDGTERASVITLYSRETNGTSPGPAHWRSVLEIKAKSGGRWAGAYNRRIGEITGAGDLTETTIATGLTLLEDEFAGGVLTMAAIPGETFEIVGNTTAGVVTVKGDSQLATKYGSSTDKEFTLFKSNTDTYGNEKSVEVLVKDGARDPVNEFGLEVYWNGTKVLDFPDLSLDPTSDVEVESVINEFSGNEEIEVTNLFTGTIAPVTRPANQFGTIPSGGLAATDLTLEWFQYYADPNNQGSGSLSAFTPGPKLQRDFVTLTCTDDTTAGSEVWSVASQTQDRSFPDAVTGVGYAAPNEYFFDFTIGTGGWKVGDKIYIMVEPIIPEEVIGGKLFYDVDGFPRNSLEIVDATPYSVSVRPGNDLTALTAIGNRYRLEYGKGLQKGYDGHSGVTDNDYIVVFDTNTSLFNRMKDRRLGLIKYAVPGVASTAVQKAARSYAEANNGPFREEIPSSIVDEVSAVEWVEDTMGRNDFAQAIFPSWYYKVDPDRDGALKLVPLTGAVQGVEALFAYSWGGYHKAAAGTDAILEKVVKVPTGNKVLNGEITNPKGLQIVAKKDGNWVIWGDRVPASATGLTWKHKREQLSHYERVLLENMDWIIFAINDEEEQQVALSALTAYFLKEWRPKRALRGNSFEDAVSIKIDSENNTNATMANGDMNCEIKLRLADTIERFNITISPAGIFESLSA